MFQADDLNNRSASMQNVAHGKGKTLYFGKKSSKVWGVVADARRCRETPSKGHSYQPSASCSKEKIQRVSRYYLGTR